MKKVIVFCGVCGTRKSTLGSLYAQQTNSIFIEADDFHSTESKEKMAQGVSLTDSDRFPWLQRLVDHIQSLNSSRVVVSCSALKKSYRNVFRHEETFHTQFVLLVAPYSVIEKRLAQRTHAFMNPNLLLSQFNTLEYDASEDLTIVSVQESLESLLQQLLSNLNNA